MGARGPAPIPTAIRELQGNAGHRAYRNEPRPAPGRPTCPRWLSKAAKAEWARIVPELERLGLLSQLDRAALAGYCQAYARWRQAEETLDAYQALVQATSTGYLAPHPAIAIAQKQLQLIRAFCHEFGLSPSARARMAMPGEVDTGGPSPFD